jgi:sugar phosphate isomerase/epimerase
VKLACQEQHIPGNDLIEKWEFITAAGFDGIELRAADGAGFRNRRDELKRAAAAGAVMPTACPETDHFIGHFDRDKRRDAIANMKSTLSVMADIGGLGAMTPASWGMFSRRLPPFDPPRTADEDREVLLEALGELGEHARREGVVLWLEPLNRYEDHMVNRIDQAVDLARATGLESVRVVGDLYHMNIEEAHIGAAIRAAKGYLTHMQIGDSNRLQPGSGHLDFSEPLQALTEIGYQGFLAMECGIDGDPERVLPAVAEHMKAHLP